MDPILAAAFGSKALGTLLQYRSNRDAADAVSAHLGEAAERNERHRRAAGTRFAETLSGFTMPAQSVGMAGRTADRTAALTGNQRALAALPGAGSAPESVRTSAARSLAHALSSGRDYATRLARAGAHGENQFDNRLSLGRGREDLNVISDFASGDASLLPYRLHAAQEKAIDPLAEFLMGMGDIAAMGSGFGWGQGMFAPAPYGATGAGKTIVGSSGMMGGGV